MKTSLLALSFVTLMCSPGLSSAGEFEPAVGLGHQFGGVLGGQFAYKTASTKYYASVGLVGFAAGLQTTFSENSKHAYGIVVGREELQSEDGFAFITYDYHFDGFAQKGFVIGTGIGVTREDEGGLYADKGDTDTSTSITLNFGYKF
ncbi:hypothetical protein L2737_03225 [Shewanella electrodiphila]|uniref:Outer membrane protein beta-barrel domain-containing protein n=1 Tax=Shewanella electrodiphila TaxID=934143 RepID=A0ABT0KKJ5_9GAMM|nr:hypothetical protein [Shewanella electrodiphila]MCL1044346.1 hypothetical protein [Shewanella electrodiphila]